MGPFSPADHRKIWELKVSQDEINTIKITNWNTPRKHPRGLSKLEVISTIRGPEDVHIKEEGSTEPWFSTFEYTEEQKYAMYLVLKEQNNVFITGSAGTGKTLLLKYIIKQLIRKYGKDHVAITSTTGFSALSIGGQTIHKFAGIGLGDQSAENLIKRVRNNTDAVIRWQSTEVLVIDEVSLINADLFSKLNEVATAIRMDNAPFGGIQLVLCGDFLQLLPGLEPPQMPNHIFETEQWQDCIDEIVNLTKVHRQKDPAFLKALNEVRERKVSEETLEYFKNLARVPNLPEGAVITKVFPVKEKVQKANEEALKTLDGTTYVFHSTDSCSYGNISAKDLQKLNKAADKVLSLKIGAKVMLTRNLSDTLVNGSQGVVVAMVALKDLNKFRPYPGQQFKRIKTEESNGSSNFENVDSPTNDFAVYPPEHEHEHEHDYEEILDDGFDSMDFEELKDGDLTNYLWSYPPVLSWTVAENLSDYWASSAGLLPLVKFSTPRGDVHHLVRQMKWYESNKMGFTTATRLQLPLTLGWAMTIHKSQGQKSLIYRLTSTRYSLMAIPM